MILSRDSLLTTALGSQTVDHWPHVRSFQGNRDPLGMYTELSIHFLVRSLSLSFCLGLLEACLLGNWVTVYSRALNPKD